MRNILKKDLPFAKAGDEIVKLSSCTTMDFYGSTSITHHFAIAKNKSLTFRVDGSEYDKWIGEIQVPREYYVYVDRNNILCAVSSKSDCNFLDNLNWTEIKVREVL